MATDILSESIHVGMEHEIASALKGDGIYCLCHAVNTELLNSLRIAVDSILDNYTHTSVSLVNICKNNYDTAFNSLQRSISLRTLLQNLSSCILQKLVVDSDLISVLRIVTGPNSKSESLKFHFDATAITALIPLYIPESVDDGGHLIIWPNLRNIRSNSLINIIEKIIIQNIISRKIISKFLTIKSNNKVVLLKPGNIYLFCGYKSLHANLPINPNFVRATILLHYGNVHPNSIILTFVVRLRHYLEGRRLNKSQSTTFTI